MNKIVFAAATYDVDILLRLVGLGHKAYIPTESISVFSSAKNTAVRIGYEVNGKTHLLTGTLEADKPVQELIMISKHTLKKALIPVMAYQDRRAMPKQDDNWRWQNNRPHQSNNGW